MDTVSQFDRLKASKTGLSSSEAASRIRTFGPNVLKANAQELLIIRFLKQFLNPLILLLLFASAISLSLRNTLDFVIIVSIIFVSVSLDFFQQYKAERAVEKLREQVSLTTTVLRDGHEQEISLAQLVPGDVVLLTPGSIIPADCILFESNELLVDQSVLSGESIAQEKQAPNNLEQPNTDNRSRVFLGSHVISGTGKALVITTGKNTELGKIGKELSQKAPETAFEHGLKHFGYLLMRITFILTIFVFFSNAFFKHDVLSSFIFALALAVGLTPELLPIIITLNLSRGALRMAKKGVIVKHLPSIQNLGSMEILCTDKTGTLTENKITLECYEDSNQQESTKVLHLGFLNSYFASGIKNPLDEAVLAHHEVMVGSTNKITEVPFDFDRRAQSVILNDDKKALLICKGAADYILSCAKLDDALKLKIHARFKELSQQGFRVLAVGTKIVKQKADYNPQDETGLTFQGLMAFLDPPKAGVKDVLKELERYHIAIKIITGDNELVTKKICDELELPVTRTLTGVQVADLTDNQLAVEALKTTIFARISPEQKRRIIIALKQHDKAIGFLGDGINDAPSLHAADIGISVNNGTDVAKEAASLILLSKSLSAIKDGVIEGRKTYVNTMKYIMMATSSNFGNMFSVAAASLFLPYLPMLPTQILLNNLVYDASQLAIATDNVDADYLHEPKKWDIHFIRKFMITFGPISSLFDFITFAFLLFAFHVTMPQFRTGWFIESLVSQSVIILTIRTKKVPFYKSKPKNLLVLSILAVVLFAVVLPVTPLAKIFMFVPMSMVYYVYLSIAVLAYFLIVELVKQHFYAHKHVFRRLP